MTDQELEAKKQEFLDIWDTHVKRPGADRLRSYLQARAITAHMPADCWSIR